MSVMVENQCNDMFFENQGNEKIFIFIFFFEGAKIFEGGWE